MSKFKISYSDTNQIVSLSLAERLRKRTVLKDSALPAKSGVSISAYSMDAITRAKRSQWQSGSKERAYEKALNKESNVVTSITLGRHLRLNPATTHHFIVDTLGGMCRTQNSRTDTRGKVGVAPDTSEYKLGHAGRAIDEGEDIPGGRSVTTDASTTDVADEMDEAADPGTSPRCDSSGSVVIGNRKNPGGFRDSNDPSIATTSLSEEADSTSGEAVRQPEQTPASGSVCGKRGRDADEVSSCESDQPITRGNKAARSDKGGNSGKGISVDVRGRSDGRGDGRGDGCDGDSWSDTESVTELTRETGLPRVTRASLGRESHVTPGADVAPRTTLDNCGQLVWGKFGSHSWWPAVIITGDLCHMQQAKFLYVWLFWFGDHKVSQIQTNKTRPFASNFPEMYRSVRPKGKLWSTGVLEAVRECEFRSGSNLQRSDGELMDWAGVDFPGYFLHISPPNAENLTIPRWIKERLRWIGERHDSGENERGEVYDIRTQSSVRASVIERLTSSLLNIQDVCISCLDLQDPVVSPHPFFVGGVCQHCKNTMLATMYAVGDDGSAAFCTVCANGGNLFVCSSPRCQRVYCCQCVDDFVGQGASTRIAGTHPWMCFLCEPDQPSGLLIVQPDWQNSILNMFNSHSNIDQPLDRNKIRAAPLRVLSLFDGIGTGRYVLDLLDMKVDAYYSCEVDTDAVVVTSVNMADKVIQLGDVTKLDVAKIKEICPIDLVIGGSPCNDISCVNPARKGLSDFDGTGVLFFEFYRLLSLVRECCRDNHVLWMFENVAFMPHNIRTTITRFLQCEPALWDSKFFSAQNRPRLFWGNIPGIYSTPEVYSNATHHTLEAMLTPNCGRHARVDKIRTVTTRSNSLKQGRNDDVFPVSMAGCGDVVWIQELERIFGFPEHYTDVSNLAPGRRQKLLGKAWSAVVVKHILSPLTQFFPTNQAEDPEGRTD